MPRSTTVSLPATAGARSRVWTVLLAALSIILAGTAAYSNSFRGAFVFDDFGSITENPSIRNLRPLWPVLTSGSYATVIGRPLLNLSLALNYAWGGTDVWGYHVVNLILHLSAALLLLGLIRRTLLLPGIPEHFARRATGLAWAGALIWTLHPLQTESVTYVVQRAESLVGIFYLLTLYCLVRGANAHLSVPWSLRSIWYLASILACWLGMASKEVMVSAPVICLVYDRCFLAGSFLEAVRRRGLVYLGLMSAWVGLGVLMSSSGGRSNTAGFGFGMSPWDYAMTQFGAIAGYLRLCFWPDPLILDYGTRIARSAGEIVPPALLIGALVTATFWALYSHPRGGFLGLCFFAILAPSSSVVPLVTQTIAEHRMYLPLAPVVILAVITACEAWEQLAELLVKSQRPRAGLFSGVPAFTIIIVSAWLGYKTFLRNQDYRTSLAMWEDNTRKLPDNPRPYYGIARDLLDAKDPRGAIEACNRALRLDPQCDRAYLNRANAYSSLQEWPPALADYARAIELNPGDPRAYLNRANAYGVLEEWDAAFEDYQRALRLNPLDAATYYNRAIAYGKAGRDQDSLSDLDQAIRLDPRDAGNYLARGIVQKRLGNYERASVDFTNAIRFDPLVPKSYNLRGHCHKLLGRLDQAIQDYTRALELQPTFVDALNNRGAAYGQLERREQAIEDFTRVIELAPNFAPAYENRAICHYDLRQFARAWADVRAFENAGGRPDPEFIKELTAAAGNSP